MNSTMNAATLSINPNANSDSNLKRRSYIVDLNLVHRNDKATMQRSRKRTSAIESPSDLLVDVKKDDLLSTSWEDKRDRSTVLYEDTHVMRFQKTNANLRFLYDRDETFKYALELFNRSHCFFENGCWQSNENFFECKGAIRVVQRMCTRCRDIDKPRTKTDLYYVNLAEHHRERTIFCHGCMGRIVSMLVGTSFPVIKKQLKKLRKRQQSGIYILSRGNQ